jgi:hypothetical protein
MGGRLPFAYAAHQEGQDQWRHFGLSRLKKDLEISFYVESILLPVAAFRFTCGSHAQAKLCGSSRATIWPLSEYAVALLMLLMKHCCVAKVSALAPRMAGGLWTKGGHGEDVEQSVFCFDARPHPCSCRRGILGRGAADSTMHSCSSTQNTAPKTILSCRSVVQK